MLILSDPRSSPLHRIRQAVTLSGVSTNPPSVAVLLPMMGVPPLASRQQLQTVRKFYHRSPSRLLHVCWSSPAADLCILTPVPRCARRALSSDGSCARSSGRAPDAPPLPPALGHALDITSPSPAPHRLSIIKRLLTPLETSSGGPQTLAR